MLAPACIPQGRVAFCLLLQSPGSTDRSSSASKPFSSALAVLCLCVGQAGRGLTVRLEVFKTRKCGWGARSWDRITAGQLVAVMWGKVHRSGQSRDMPAFPHCNPDNAGWLSHIAVNACPIFLQLEMHDRFSCSSKQPAPVAHMQQPRRTAGAAVCMRCALLGSSCCRLQRCQGPLH